MTAQPQIDVKFINQILNSHGKKTTDRFYLNRLNIAISQLEKVNPIEGIVARADYLDYLNEHEKALNLIDSAIERYGLKEIFLRIKIKVLSHCSDWYILKKTWQDFFSILEPDLQSHWNKIYLTHSQVFLDNTFIEQFLIPLNEKEFYKEKIQKQLYGLEALDISLNHYRKLISLVYNTLSKYYGLTDLKYMLRLNDDNVQFITQNDLWNEQDLKQLYQEVNEAILAIDDVDFQIEADNIEVVFINFPIENLPQDFRLDDDGDSDLIDIVSKRMQNTEEEMVKIEVENV